MNEERMIDVLKEIELIIWCNGEIENYPVSFHEDLNDQEREEVLRRMRNNRMMGK